MINSKEFELSTAKEVINIGIAKAADSLSFFMKEKVLLKELTFKIKKIKRCRPISTKKEEVNFVLTTEIIGELAGACYLLFSNVDAERIYRVSLPENVLSSKEQMKIMGPAMLAELDNIVSASVITQFSNLLKYKMYGGVPDLKEFSEAEINAYIASNSKKHDIAFSFKAKFSNEDNSFSPEFIWDLDAKFYEGILKYLDAKDIKKTRTTIIG
jgi:chemotaxis protein CheY-P-specific phosphatase CheC